MVFNGSFVKLFFIIDIFCSFKLLLFFNFMIYFIFISAIFALFSIIVINLFIFFVEIHIFNLKNYPFIKNLIVNVK